MKRGKGGKRGHEERMQRGKEGRRKGREEERKDFETA